MHSPLGIGDDDFPSHNRWEQALKASHPRIAIIGAGIGGLTAAVALRQRGFDCSVYEQAAELGEVGAGLTINARASLVLEALGLGPGLEALEPPTPSLGALHFETGKRLSYEQRDLDAYRERYGSVTRHVHRADLHRLLLEALPGDWLRPAHELTGVDETPERVVLQFANGEGAEYDLLMACDGLKSTVRQLMFSAEPAHFTGYVAWRGLVPSRALPDLTFDPHFAAFASPDKLFARYPVRHGSLINYVAIARKPDFTTESWHSSAEVSEVLAEFHGWHQDVVEIISATPSQRCMRWALYTRQPLDRWVTRRMALLGDAAHPMTPFYGMGANLAIEDGYILARCLEACPDDSTEGLARYERARLPRGQLMQRISLERAERYMSDDPAERSKPPAAGLDQVMEYNPITVEI
ncbi:MAG: FAD-dependent monooxygenase [Pseudomonadota bacterium]